MKQMRVGARVQTNCTGCSKPCWGERCYRCRRTSTAARVNPADLALIIDWARLARISDDMNAYARKKAAE